MTLSQLSTAVAAAVLGAGSPDPPDDHVFLALPQLGTLYASCEHPGPPALRYRVPRISATEVVTLRGRRRTVHPGQSLRFTARRVRLRVLSRTQPRDVRARVRMVVVPDNASPGECVARRARVSVSTTRMG